MYIQTDTHTMVSVVFYRGLMTQSLVPLSSSEIRLSGYHMAQSPKFLTTWLVFMAWPAPFLSHLVHINTDVV